jgi:4-hydroxybenzoate polyprenyltransferase
LAVWSGAQEAIAVNAPAHVLGQLRRTHPSAQVFDGPTRDWRTWRKALRLQQWAKNALLLIPAVAAHEWSPPVWVALGWAFVAFGLCASATYLLNDLLDIPNDRKHKTKRHRPLACGALSVASALPALGALLILAFVLATSLSWGFAAVLGCYAITTVAYSFNLKRQAVLDVLVLASLYTMRLIAGAVVANVHPSNWLLAISMFLFLSLALVKRCAELEEVIHLDDTQTARGRGYHQNDLPGLRAMGIGSGFLTVLVLALYIDSQNGQAQYPQVTWLWGVTPLMLWWIMRIWLKTGRRELQGEDPLQFALHDRFSWWTLAGMAGLVFMATRHWGL